jgi:hypothetical protein
MGLRAAQRPVDLDRPGVARPPRRRDLVGPRSPRSEANGDVGRSELAQESRPLICLISD